MDHADLRGLDQRLTDDLDQARGAVDRHRPGHLDRLGEGLGVVEQLERDPAVVAALAGREHPGNATALHALELLELALEALREPGQRDDRGCDDLDRRGLPGRPVGRAVHRARAVAAEPVAELEPGGDRVGHQGLGLERDESRSVDGAEVCVVAELLLASRAKLHASFPLITRIVRRSDGESN